MQTEIPRIDSPVEPTIATMHEKAGQPEEAWRALLKCRQIVRKIKTTRKNWQMIDDLFMLLREQIPTRKRRELEVDDDPIEARREANRRRTRRAQEKKVEEASRKTLSVMRVQWVKPHDVLSGFIQLTKHSQRNSGYAIKN
jgi:hypothetical protein